MVKGSKKNTQKEDIRCSGERSDILFFIKKQDRLSVEWPADGPVKFKNRRKSTSFSSYS